MIAQQFDVATLVTAPDDDEPSIGLVSSGGDAPWISLCGRDVL